MRQDIPWGNPPNTKDEKPKNYLSMIDRFAENDSQHISILLHKRYHPRSSEERSNATLQKILYAIVFNLPYASHINNKKKQPSMQKGEN